MAGQKKKSTGQKERSRTDSKKNAKGKKGDKQDNKSAKATIVVALSEQQALKIVRASKGITTQDLARQTGVKISTANAFLRRSLEGGVIEKIGGRSGHYIYRPVAS